MTSRDRVIRALNHQPTDQLPWFLDACRAIPPAHRDEFLELGKRFPSDIRHPTASYKLKPRPAVLDRAGGSTIDAWGCQWGPSLYGRHPEVIQPPLADPTSWDDFRPPSELLDSLDWDGMNRQCNSSSRFILARSETQPFERLQQLRGMEATFLDLGYGTPGIHRLLAILHEFFCQEIGRWADSHVDGVELKDTWGYSGGMLVSPETWREQFKPLYRDYCEILHAQDKFVFFRSSGDISEIFHDLIEIGVDAISCQVSIMDAEQLARHFRGNVTFCGEFDRQWLTRPEPAPVSTDRMVAIDAAHDSPQPSSDSFSKCGDGTLAGSIHRMRGSFDFGTGGLIGRCRWRPGMLFSRVKAAHHGWLEAVPVQG